MSVRCIVRHVKLGVNPNLEVSIEGEGPNGNQHYSVPVNAAEGFAPGDVVIVETTVDESAVGIEAEAIKADRVEAPKGRAELKAAAKGGK